MTREYHKPTLQPTRDTVNKSHKNVSSEDLKQPAISSPIKMIAKLERTPIATEDNADPTQTFQHNVSNRITALERTVIEPTAVCERGVGGGLYMFIWPNIRFRCC